MLEIKKITTFFLFINSCIIIIPTTFKVYPIILLLLSSVFLFKKYKKNSFPYTDLLLICCPYIFFLFSCFYSSDLNSAFFKLSTMAPLLVYPLIFGLITSSNFKFSRNLTNIMLICFVNSVVIFTLVSFIYLKQLDFTFSEIIIHYIGFIDSWLGKFSIHPIYLSLYIGVSLLIIIYLINENQKKVLKVYYSLIGIYLLFFLIILMRKGPIIYFIITSSFLLFNIIKFKKVLIFLSITSLITITYLYWLPNTNNLNRFRDLINKNQIENSNSSTGIRYIVYKCAIEKIKENPIFGYGLGDVKQELDSCYTKTSLNKSSLNYNSHNQYLSFILTAGIMSLITYLFSVTRFYKVLINRKNILGLCILTFFLLNLLTENIIEREDGVLLYSLFISFFVIVKDT